MHVPTMTITSTSFRYSYSHHDQPECKNSHFTRYRWKYPNENDVHRVKYECSLIILCQNIEGLYCKCDEIVIK